MKSSCVSCRQTITMPDPLEIGVVLTCPHCRVKQEIVWLFPLELMLVPEGNLPGRGNHDWEEQGLPERGIERRQGKREV